MDIAEQEQMNMKLVKEVEKYPCLYKTDTVEYSRRSITDKAWTEVGRVVGWPGPKCKEKFKNIRSVVCRYQKSKDQGIKRRPYYLMEAMRYTFPYIKFKQNPIKTCTDQRSDTFENTMHFQEVNEQHNFITSVKIENHDADTSNKSALELNYCDESPERSQTIEEYPESRSPSPLSPAPAIKDNGRTQNGCNQTEQGSNIDTSAALTDSRELQNDPKKMFLLSLLPDIYEMNDAQTRKFKRGVVQLVDDILSNTHC